MTGSWLQRLTRDSDVTTRLVCFPHAGGTPANFRAWPQALTAGTELLSAHYPGHGSRLSETPVDRIPTMAQSVMDALLERPALPTIFFGHSMGGLVAFEVARRLTLAALPTPARLFVSGHAPPHRPPANEPFSHLPDLDFLRVLDERFAAVPPELLQYPDLLALLLPALRADVAAVEAYRPAKHAVLACPLSAFGGTDDATATPDDLEAWGELTRGPFDVRLFAGGHFYINDDRHRETVVAEVRAALDALRVETAHAQPAIVPAERTA